MAAPTTASKKAKSKAKSTKSSITGTASKSLTAGALSREIGGVVILAIALAVLLALGSFNPADVARDGVPTNLIGPVGVFVGDALLFIFGVGAFFLNALLWYLGISMLIGRQVDAHTSDVAGKILFVFAGAVLSHLALSNYLILGHMPGGLVGEFGGEVMRGLVGTVGTYIIVVCGLMLSVVLVTDLSLGAIARALLARGHRFMAYLRHQLAVRREFKARYAEERQRLLSGEESSLEARARAEAELSVTPITPDSYEFEEGFEEEVESKVASRLGRLVGKKVDKAESKRDEKPKKEAPIKKSAAKIDLDEGWELGELPNTADDIEVDPEIIETSTDESIEVSDTDVVDMAAEKKPAVMVRGPEADFGPQIVESEATKRSREKKDMLAGKDVTFKPMKKGNFELPPISFLNYDRTDDVVVDTDMLRTMAAQIEKTLSDFKVDGTIVEICPGPVITMFEFSPAPGVKISRIAGLADDLAMSLAALSVRIVAPIPGKGVVGIEVPNPSREMVYLKEIIADESFMDNTKMILPLALGKNTEGSAVLADLAKMPHLLVAGATGAGKSVAVNTMICSLLYKNTPDDVRMIMVDPKMLEFSIYADIPHLLLPVVTDPKQATVALNWTVQEMERRYQALADMGVRDISGYNKKVAVLTKQAELDQLEGREGTEALRALGIDSRGNPEHKRIPYIIVIIDEFADLMMTASKDVETAVARLAQKARAAGIHLILATQRPSTDVITGLIKANFPTRLALRVTSKTDSRVILDSNGAENLLGNGDMLFVPPGSSNLQRTHGAYVSEKEIDQIVAFLKAQGEPEYNDAILVEEGEEGENAIDEADKDEHYEEAVRLVVDSKQASISMLQRKLRVGYNRAARMVDIMEMEGIVGVSDSCKPREVLVDVSPY
ncbi:MAG: DNA translocase FtsK [Bradymonadaceae bacterium]